MFPYEIISDITGYDAPLESAAHQRRVCKVPPISSGRVLVIYARARRKLLHTWMIWVSVKHHLVHFFEWMDLLGVYNRFSPRLDPANLSGLGHKKSLRPPRLRGRHVWSSKWTWWPLRAWYAERMSTERVLIGEDMVSITLRENQLPNSRRRFCKFQAPPRPWPLHRMYIYIYV